jgi:uncharacterized protein (DUF1810 family)
MDAQDNVFDSALAELKAGEKRGHWIWFVFPQLTGLGRSPTSQYYAIRSADEARAYLAHPLLGERLRQAVEAILPWAGKRDAVAIFGGVDAMKLRSSLTLFDAATEDPLFGRALAAFFGEPDDATLRLLH